MKKLFVLAILATSLFVSGSAMAAKDPVDLMHCGCIYVATDETTGTASMVWHNLLIGKGKGHRNHVVDHEDACLSGYEEVFCTQEQVDSEVEGCDSTADVFSLNPLYDDFVRDEADCTLAGTIGGLAACDGVDAEDVGEQCGSEL